MKYHKFLEQKHVDKRWLMKQGKYLITMVYILITDTCICFMIG